jgi:hypothetical protein
MKNRIVILCFFVAGLAFQMQARNNYRGLSLGANAGYANYGKLDFEGFAQANFKFGQTPFEPRLGLAYRSFSTDYNKLSDLNVNSFGLILGSDIYPFKKIFFTGVLFEIDLNRFDTDAMNAINKANETATRTFPGFRANIVAGLDIPVSRRISLRLSGMPGWQFYVISDDWDVSSGGAGVEISTRNGSTFSRFVYHLNVGLAIRLWNK